MPLDLPYDDEHAWESFRDRWTLREDTIYLNHGSFGPPPRLVQAERRRLQAELDAQPMDFFYRRMEGEMQAARAKLADFVAAAVENLVLVDNATYGMNVVADSFPLQPGDEVLLTDHEYGAVNRIWQRACERAGARLEFVTLPLPIESSQQLVEAVGNALSPRAKLLVVSHITSPTAITLPVDEISRLARRRGVAVCIDGPHAVAQLPLRIDALDCDFYTASCHKWLCAPFGSGFLYVHPRRQPDVEPVVLSWGRLRPDRPERWSDEFYWLGTRDPSALLATGAAIDFLQDVGLELFRQRTHFLAQYARQRLLELTGLEPLVPDSPIWYGSMAHAPLPPGEAKPLQDALWRQHGIEVPIVEFAGRRWIRVSCHLYTQQADIDALVDALRELL